MGQHKTNPTAILAKEGKLPPKQKGMSKSEQIALVHKLFQKHLIQSIMKGSNYTESTK